MVKINISNTHGYLVVKIFDKLSQIFFDFQEGKWVSILPRWHFSSIIYVCLFIIMINNSYSLNNLVKVIISHGYGYLKDTILTKFNNLCCDFQMKNESDCYDVDFSYQHFMYTYSLLKEIAFRALTIWSQSTFHILMNIWWLQFWQTFTNVFVISREKWVSMLPRWSFL